MKIAIINSSDIAKRRIIPALKQIPDVEITAVCSRDLEKAKSYATEFGILFYTNEPDIIDNVDAVYISSPPGLHYQYVKKFIDKGIHVFCEKSLTVKPGETEYLVKEAEHKGVIIQENYAFEYHPQWIWIKDNLDKIGDLQYIRASFEFPPRNPLEDFRYKKELGGGSLYDAGGYPIKLASMLMSDLKCCKSTCKVSDKYGVDLSGNCYVIDELGTPAFLSWGFQSNYKCYVELVGSEGTITANKIFTPKANESVSVHVKYLDNSTEDHVFTDDHFVQIFKDFKRRIKTNNNSHHINLIKQSNWQSYVSTFGISTIIK